MEKLDFYLEHKQIPNLLFHGPSGSGKKTILQVFPVGQQTGRPISTSAQPCRANGTEQ